MKTHTSDYKNEIKEFGRQITSKITYGTTELGDEELNSVTPSFESAILKSCMKKLEIDSNVDIPLETQINYQLGCLIEDEYEYIDFGNYIVYSSEKQEDLGSYKIIAYDKMLYAMKDYEDLNIQYPVTIQQYLNSICTKLGLTNASALDEFVNYDKFIEHELYLNDDGDSIGYTYRDVLDEIAQATASTIVINQNDELEVRYINDTNDTIDEEYLNSVNVNFGEKFGPINSIVLSRAESDKVYLQDSQSVEQNGLCEICINDNQIMNGDDRNTYLVGILGQLDGLEYYLNDFSSTGITYYDVCDKYNVSIGENTYPCIMFNDEILITQGLSENVYTDMPQESETDYKKADKQDRINNQTKIVVDKHNQQISTLITYVGDRSQKTTSLTQDVDGLISQVQNIPTIITEQSGYGSVTLLDLANTKLGMIKVHPTNNIDIIRNIASPHLKVRVGNKVGVRGITFESGTEFELMLPTNLYYYDSETYDEFIIDGLEERKYVIHRVGWSGNTKYALQTPTIEEFTYSNVMIDEGDLTVSYEDYPSAYIYVKAMIKNEFTQSFATELELKSTIEQTANAIGLNVEEFKEGDKVSGATILAQINNDESEVQINADKINLNGVVTANENFKILSDGSMEAKAGTFKGTINTDNDCIVGNNLVVGANDDPLNPTPKSIKITEWTELYRSAFQGVESLTISSGRITFALFRYEQGEGTSSIEGIYPVKITWDEITISDNPLRIKVNTTITKNLTINGDLNVNGSKNRVVSIDDGSKVKLNAYETSEAYFGDLGSGITNENGECRIDIEDIFKQTINLENYKVFIQELGNGKLYVEKHNDYFIVKGTPNLEFDYEIKAKQKGYENVRLEKVERSDNE